MTADSLNYATPPATTWWRRWRGRLLAGGMVVGSHLVAAACTLALLIAAGGLFGVISAIMTIFTPVPGGDGPGALEAMVGAIILGVFLAIVGALFSVPVIFAGIAIDAARRPLRLPWWAVLLIVPTLAELGGMTGWLMFGGFSIASLAWGALLGLAIAALFCAYWIPLGCAEGILRLVKRTLEHFVTWWKLRGQRKETMKAMKPREEEYDRRPN